jgi:hypothetical protein
LTKQAIASSFGASTGPLAVMLRTNIVAKFKGEFDGGCRGSSLA